MRKASASLDPDTEVELFPLGEKESFRSTTSNNELRIEKRSDRLG